MGAEDGEGTREREVKARVGEKSYLQKDSTLMCPTTQLTLAMAQISCLDFIKPMHCDMLLDNVTGNKDPHVMSRGGLPQYCNVGDTPLPHMWLSNKA